MAADSPQHKMSAASGPAAARKLHLARQLAQNGRMIILLLLLLVSIFVGPAILPEGTRFRLFGDIMIVFVLFSGVVAISDHRKLAIALTCLAVLVIAVRWAEWFVAAQEVLAFRYASTLCACVVLAIAVGFNVFAPGRSIADRVFGAIILYLLIGLIAAFAYSAVYKVNPDAFSKLPGGSGELDSWLYFSFVTLTTVGYGDITPLTRLARAIAILEALVGQLYPAIIIARFVSLPGDSTK